MCLSIGQRAILNGIKNTVKYNKKSTAALTIGCIAMVVGIIMGLATYCSNPTLSFQWDRFTPSIATSGGGCFLALLGKIGFLVNKERGKPEMGDIPSGDSYTEHVRPLDEYEDGGEVGSYGSDDDSDDDASIDSANGSRDIRPPIESKKGFWGRMFGG